MSDEQHEPDEKALTDAARQRVEEDFRDADDRPMGPIGHVPSRSESAERAGEGGLTEAALPDGGTTADDAAPETLIPDDGSRSPEEAGIPDTAADTELTEVGKAGAGGRYGLDEAELGRVDPLDGKPWDGDPNEPLEPETTHDRNLASDPDDAPGSA